MAMDKRRRCRCHRSSCSQILLRTQHTLKCYTAFLYRTPVFIRTFPTLKCQHNSNKLNATTEIFIISRTYDDRPSFRRCRRHQWFLFWIFVFFSLKPNRSDRLLANKRGTRNISVQLKCSCISIYFILRSPLSFPIIFIYFFHFISILNHDAGRIANTPPSARSKVWG